MVGWSRRADGVSSVDAPRSPDQPTRPLRRTSSTTHSPAQPFFNAPRLKLGSGTWKATRSATPARPGHHTRLQPPCQTRITVLANKILHPPPFKLINNTTKTRHGHNTTPPFLFPNHHQPIHPLPLLTHPAASPCRKRPTDLLLHQPPSLLTRYGAERAATAS